MARSRLSLGWTAALLAAAVALIAAMVLLTQAARSTSRIVRGYTMAAGPAITAADLPRLMSGIPVCPFLSFDPDSTNSPVLRMLLTGVSPSARPGALVFRRSRPFDLVVTWYRGELRDWALASREDAYDRDSRKSHWVGFRKGRRAFYLFDTPAFPDRVILLTHDRPPRTLRRTRHRARPLVGFAGGQVYSSSSNDPR